MTKVTAGTTCQLKYSIEIHHATYNKLFGPLEPKFHFLTHYPRLLERFGPPITYWCMRYEIRHRGLKATSYSTSGNKNSLYTIAVKEMLKFCNFMNKAEIQSPTKFGYKDADRCTNEVLLSISEDVMSDAQFHCNVEIYEEDYKISDVFLVDTEPKLIFGEIVKVIASKNRDFLTLKLSKEDFYDTLYCAHKVVEKKKLSPKHLMIYLNIHHVLCIIKIEIIFMF